MSNEQSTQLVAGEQQSGQLVDVANLPVSPYFDQDAFLELTKTSFVPRLQLCGGNSEAVKAGLVPIQSYALAYTKTDLRDLGKSVDCVPLSARLCAVRIAGDEVFSYYDHNSDEFRKVITDSEQPNSGCMYGPQYLLWIPSVSEFATFLFGNKSTRKEARNLQPLLGRAATLKSKYVKTAKHSWHVPIVLPCSARLSVPSQDKIDKATAMFNNPAKSSVELNPEEMEKQGEENADGRVR